MKPDLASIYRKLRARYGERNWWPIVRNGKCEYLEEFRKRNRSVKEIFEIMIGAILTQNTSWDNVVKTIVGMKKLKLFSLNGLRNAPAGKLAVVVRPSGYYNQKAKKIKHLVRFIDSELKGDILRMRKMGREEAREKLLGIWGVGPETADSILLYGYGFPVFVVDAYTRRIFSRLGLIDDEDYENVRRTFESGLKNDTDLFREYHAVIVEHGKNVCKTKPLCGECVLARDCAFSNNK